MLIIFSFLKPSLSQTLYGVSLCVSLESDGLRLSFSLQDGFHLGSVGEDLCFILLGLCRGADTGVQLPPPPLYLLLLDLNLLHSVHDVNVHPLLFDLLVHLGGLNVNY